VSPNPFRYGIDAIIDRLSGSNPADDAPVPVRGVRTENEGR
jgi:hypothetical protein